MEVRIAGVCVCVCVCVCAHVCASMGMRGASGWLINWLVFSQSNYFVNLLSVFSLRIFSFNYSFKVFFLPKNSLEPSFAKPFLSQRPP